jgi:hypothetical protein
MFGLYAAAGTFLISPALQPLCPELAFRFFIFWSIAAPPQLIRLILAKQFLDRRRFSILVTALIRLFPNQSLKERVLKILAEYRVRAAAPEQAAAFAEEVQREAH